MKPIVGFAEITSKKHKKKIARKYFSHYTEKYHKIKCIVYTHKDFI